jgi:hypothetical protein
MDKVKMALTPAALLIGLATSAALVVGGCANGNAPQEGGYQKKTSGGDMAGPYVPPDLMPPSDLALADLANVDYANSPYDFAQAPGPDMRMVPCNNNCYRIIAVDGELPAYKADGKDWDSDTDAPDPYVRITFPNGTTYRSPKQDGTWYPTWNHTLVDDVSVETLGQGLRFQFLEQDGLFNADDPIDDVTKVIDASVIAAGGFTEPNSDGFFKIAIQKQ